MRVTSSQKKGGKTSRKKIEKYDEVSIQNDLQEDSKPFGDSEMKHQNNDLELEQDDGHSSSVEADSEEDIRPKNKKIKRNQKKSDDSKKEKISGTHIYPEEVVWKEARKIWRDTSKDDVDFIQNLLNESSQGFDLYMKETYEVNGQNLPVIFPSACPQSASIFKPVPPPPKDTIASTMGKENLAMQVAARGGLDEISSRVMMKECDEAYPASSHIETEKVLKAHWTKILDHSKRLASNQMNHQDEPNPSKSLGKRGRLYNDIWNEEDFLDKNRTYSLSTCATWSDILRNYHDDHDGCYIEWLLYQLHQRKQTSAHQPHNRQSHRDPSQLDSKIPTNIFEHVGISFVPPPVPVCTQHPASWGPGNRISNPPLLPVNMSISPIIHQSSENYTTMKDKLRSRYTALKANSPRAISGDDHNCRQIATPELYKNQMIDVNLIHPACVSKTILYPPGFQNHSMSMSNDAKKETPEFECIDEIGIHAEYLSQLLKSVSARNFAYLSEIMTSTERDIELSHLRQTKQRLLTSCHAISKIMTESRKRNVQQSFIPTLQHGQNHELSLHSAIISMLRQSKSQTSLSSGSAPLLSTPSLPSTTSPSLQCHPFQRLSLTRPIYPDSFGSLTTKHINYATFIQSLKLGSKIEVKLHNLSFIWSACYVTDLKYDEAGVLRFLETCPISGTFGGCQWNAVEDDSLAPPGTHLPSFLFEQHDF